MQPLNWDTASVPVGRPVALIYLLSYSCPPLGWHTSEIRPQRLIFPQYNRLKGNAFFFKTLPHFLLFFPLLCHDNFSTWCTLPLPRVWEVQQKIKLPRLTLKKPNDYPCGTDRPTDRPTNRRSAVLIQARVVTVGRCRICHSGGGWCGAGGNNVLALVID